MLRVVCPTFAMPDTRLPKRSQAAVLWLSRKIWDDVPLSDHLRLNIRLSYHGAQIIISFDLIMISTWKAETIIVALSLCLYLLLYH